MPDSVVPTHYRSDFVLGGTEIAIRVRRGGRDEQFGSLVNSG